MKLNHFPFYLIFLLSVCNAFAQVQYTKNVGADVQKYIFNLALNDATNQIEGEAQIKVKVDKNTNSFTLDLIEKSGDYGMVVSSVLEDDKKASYTYANNKIKIDFNAVADTTKTFTITYKGIPERGLVIDTTKYGKRSFFGDNWPTLARHWLPCVDHPYDKAAVTFAITAPDHYDVVATGKKIEESNLGNGYKLTTYEEPAPVPMKVITIGVTEFASAYLGTVNNIPISAWVYPENRLEGFNDYAVAVKVLQYFIDNVGPYSYAKLANMQAKTQWGGLENAGTIAYFEDSVTGENKVEGLIAHEIAHQWFGNSATEGSWNHVWLSEGFATYFSLLYLEHVYGNDKRKEVLKDNKKKVIAYYKRNPSPIVDMNITEAMKVLSINTYEKGGWVLNMLRHKLGDEVFWEGIRLYYNTFKDSNAMTEDFQKAMEEVSGQSLDAFFNQWIFTKGFPELKYNYTYKKGKIVMEVAQEQDHFTFSFPLEIGIVTKNGMEMQTIDVDKKSVTVEIPVSAKPTSIVLDPEEWLLFEDKNE